MRASIFLSCIVNMHDTLLFVEVNGVFQKVQDEVAATTPWQIRK